MAWIYQPATPGSTADTSTPIEWKGTFNDYNGVTFEMHPAECGEAGCSSCCSNAMMCMLTWGTCVCVAPRFTIQINEDGKTGVGKDSKIMGCLPMSPIPCFNGCGFGPCAFVSPFTIEDLGNGQGKWVGNGQVVAGGCCPCMNNIGDYGINNAMLDGSAPEKAHNFYAVSLFWPPCLNGQCCGKGKPAMRMTQLGVGKPVLAASSGDGAPAATEITDRENPAVNFTEKSETFTLRVTTNEQSLCTDGTRVFCNGQFGTISDAHTDSGGFMIRIQLDDGSAVLNSNGYGDIYPSGYKNPPPFFLNAAPAVAKASAV